MTTEVIELLSSSSPEAAPPKQKLISRSSASIERLDFSSDDIDDTGSIDSEIDWPSKRLRRSPEPDSQPEQPGASFDNNPMSNITFEISSDHESLLHAKFDIAMQASKRSPERQIRVSLADDIIFSSSAPEPRTKEQKNFEATWKFSLDDSQDALMDDPPFTWSEPTRMELQDEVYSNRTANLLANLTQECSKDERAKSRLPKSKASENRGNGKSSANVLDDIVFSSNPAQPRTTKTSKLSESEKACKAAERARAKASRSAEMESKKERKRLERERKALEKQKAADLAEVNRTRTNKKDAAPEMIVDMSSFLKDTHVGNQVEEYMKKVEVEVNYIDEEANLIEGIPQPDQYGNIVTWRRKVTSTYNDEDGQWEPASRSRIVTEKHVLIHLPAVEFAAMVAGPKSASTSTVSASPTEAEMKLKLDAHVALIRRRFRDCIPIYLIEGLNGWLKKNVNAKSRDYVAAVRAQMLQPEEGSSSNAAPSGTEARSRKRKKTAIQSLDLSFVTSDIVENLLLHLQLAHQPILIHHTVSPGTTAFQISTLTQHLATRPYRLAQLNHNLKFASFCMDSGQVRAGDDAQDTFVKMLQEIQRVTPSMAYGIVNQWNTVRKLINGFDQHGNLLLEDVRKSVNKDGGWSDKRLGPMISRRLFKVFMGRDPSTTDGMS
ncbi:uncharacterized protein Z518_10970 [Rhinocladiella mackenziei CBS 650.93]|uniref:ERCC4 domain-containing protein n=1 Tax=Rhinocladiella mackenziei CBS 650.93 TaxID=1442369 RepID=A0A0D2GNZ8_9EURO|nr:uncharacterized protein Z518_10970 [Rhinocladiella mackenziei CBS 650.93]KIX00043.1 hypothetical protein Z518_10970 [Rhinocladiella mackenziei CBS 650.93]